MLLQSNKYRKLFFMVPFSGFALFCSLDTLILQQKIWFSVNVNEAKCL